MSVLSLHQFRPAYAGCHRAFITRRAPAPKPAMRLDKTEQARAALATGKNAGLSLRSAGF